MSKENKNDAQNRCRRCDRPISNPTANYGPWYAKIIGADTYNQVASTLDSKALEEYNAYVDYLSYDNTDEYKNASNPSIIGRTAILAPLFNQGEKNPPHSNPKAGPFGEQAKKEYYYMRELLGLD